MNKELKKIIWCLILFSIISLAGTIAISVPIGLVYDLVSGNTDGNYPDFITTLGMAFYRIAESLIFVRIFRQCTITELKQEKAAKPMILPSIVLMMFFAGCCVLASNQPAEAVDAAYVFRIVLIAPIFEELMFRGAIQRIFRRYYSPAFAIFASALLFSMYHMSLMQFFYTIPLGLFCGYLAEHYSVKNAMIAHIAFNSVNTIYRLLPPALVWILFLTGIISVIIIGKHRKQIRHLFVKLDKNQIKELFRNVPMILFTILWALCMLADLS